MEVKDHHNFSVNGGLIVHNCIDALRYALCMEMGRPYRREKKEDYVRDGYAEEEASINWMTV